MSSRWELSLIRPWLDKYDHPYVFLDNSNAANPSLWASIAHKKPCLMCQQFRRNFHCQNCIRKGEFCHSNLRYPESFCEKQLKKALIARENKSLEESIEERFENDNADELRERIRVTKQRIKYYQNLIKEKRDKLVKVRKWTGQLALENQKRRSRLPKFQEKVREIWCATRQYGKDLSVRERGFNQDENSLAILRRRRVLDFVTRIFTIGEVFPSTLTTSIDEESLREKLIEESLSDAIHTSFINGRWVEASEKSGEMHFKIVQSLVPGSGDFSVVHAWNQSIKNATAASTSTSSNLSSGCSSHSSSNNVITDVNIEMNPALAISSGLMYTAQLIEHLAGVLDVILPRKLNYQELDCLAKTEYKFQQLVTVLNLNALCLCLSQGVPSSNLRVSNALHNLLMLIDLSKTKSGKVGRSYRCFSEIDALYDMSLELQEELDKIPMTSEDIAAEANSQDEILGPGFGFLQRIDTDDDWDALNDELLSETPSWDDSQTVLRRSPSSESLGSSIVSFPSASNLVSSIWRGFTG